MNYTTIEIENKQGIAYIWLNRPDVRNAMNAQMFVDLHHALDAAIANPVARVIVLGGRGKAFCAGGDLSWMKTAKNMSIEQAKADSMPLAFLLRKIHDSPKPTVARVHGPAFAGGMGLVAACDIAICNSDVKFSLSEVKLGLIPATISPYVVKAMGANQSRRYFITGEIIDATEAHRIGFVHELVAPQALDECVQKILGHLTQGAPNALTETKQLLRDVTSAQINDSLSEDTAGRIARIRASDEAQEGIKAFFEKRPPSWIPQ
jgi:methylglutaconyl-CoA hydratase